MNRSNSTSHGRPARAEWQDTGRTPVRLKLTCVVLAAVGCVAGCGSTPIKTQNQAAHQQWDQARASVLASLAADQFKNGNLDKCRQTLDQAIRLTPDSAPLRKLSAKLAIEQGSLEVAVAELDKARTVADDAEVDYLGGIVWQRWHKPDKALDCYRSAGAKAPAEPGYLLAESETLVSLGKPDEAIARLTVRLDDFPHTAAIRDELGQLLARSGRTTEAVARLQEAAALAEQDPSISEHLGFAMLAAKQFAPAADVFDRLSRDESCAGRADIFAALGQCHIQTGRLTDARADFETATKLRPDGGGYWIELARVSAEMNDYRRAELAIGRAKSIGPMSADGWCLLGYVRYRQDRLPEALEAFKSATAADASDTVGLSMTGLVLTKMNRAAEAPSMYAKALAINPKDPLAGRLMSAVDVRE